MQQQGSARLSSVSQGSARRSLLTKSARSLGGTSSTVKQTADLKRALTSQACQNTHLFLSSNLGINLTLCVIGTHQADSSAAEAGAWLCFVHLCM